MNKLTIVIRNLLRRKLNTSVIIASLAIGMACVSLIALFIQRELSTDSFQRYKAQIYALKCDDPMNKGAKIYQCREGSSEYMKANFAQVEDFCRIKNSSVQRVVVNKESYFDGPKIIGVSKNFFDFFSYNLQTNNSLTALDASNNLVISTDLAKKYFGPVDPIGQVITLVDGDKQEQMVVTGIFQKPVENSQLRFDMVMPIGEMDSYCFVRLNPKAKVAEMETIFKNSKASIPVIHAGTPGQYYLEPLLDSYFVTLKDSSIKASRDKKDLWVAFVIGLIIICIATFNYLGLLNNSLLEKNKAYAVLRINGGSKLGFVLGFMAESLLILCISFIISIFLLFWVIPFFNVLTTTNITSGYILRLQQILIISAVIVILLFVSFLFVSFRISANINLNALKPGGSRIGKHTQFPMFNVFQLASSLVLISFSIVIMKQINYVTQKQIGLDKQVIEVKIPEQYADKVSVFKTGLVASSFIAKVSIASASPIQEHWMVSLNYKENGIEKENVASIFTGDENYISTLGIQIIEGSGFPGNQLTDKNKCLINESLSRLFPGQNLIGKELPGMKSKIVTGIVKDFHYSSLKSLVEPAFIAFDPKGLNLMVKASENQLAQAQGAIAKTWKKLIPDYPLNMETIGDRYEWLHLENKKYLQLIGSCCFISIFLSMIGLFAISFQSSRQRTKEIGIRKVNGARVSEILTMLNRDFVKWVIIAFVIATPIAYYAMNKWLESFAYKTSLSWWIFALAGLLALGIALLTVSLQSWKAATRNPVEALRYE